ncbi:MAG: GH39 family glycosyl hydrolase [Thermomicrobiales bacterium]
MKTSLNRRALLIGAAAAAAGALLAACGGERAVGSQQPADSPHAAHAAQRAPAPAVGNDDAVLITSATPTGDPPIRTDLFGMVGVFDVDWLADPSFTPLLDNLAASPGAFTAVRFFGALNSGTKEKTAPTESRQSVVGSQQSAIGPQSFVPALAGLEALTSRGLIPFVQLSFFPPSISASPTLPPASFDDWQALVRAFLDALVADPRFGLDAIITWWFEIWNEPNIPVFWQGTFDQYLDLYRATARAVRATGYPIRLGGPALAWLPATDDAAGAPLMRRFLQFLHDEPDVQCDFLSFHEKGTWVNPDQGNVEPVLGDLVTAAEETARMTLTIVPERSTNSFLPIINNEADMKVGFDIPYEPRMTEQFSAWLASLFIAYDDLTVKYRDTGIRFHAAADDANLQLVQAPFDGRRSVMTRASSTATSDLFKLPVYHFYELLHLLGNARGTVSHGADCCYPGTDLFHLLTVGEQQVSALFSVYPTDAATAQPRAVDFTITDLPWQRVNVARFQIDATRSNAYTLAVGSRQAAVGRPSVRSPQSSVLLRQAQELALFAPIQHDMTVVDGTFRDRFTIAPFVTLLYWLTPFLPEIPAAPRWVTTAVEDGNVILRWEPSRDVSFFSYQVFVTQDDQPDALLSPVPLRAAQWIDTAPPAGTRRYRIQTMSASEVSSPAALSDPVIITG